MKFSLRTNISALKALRVLKSTSDALGTVQQRLASGARINKASDDAAGLAVAQSLKVQGKVYATAERNLNDGISAVGVAEAAVQELTDVGIRLTELTNQATSTTLTYSQRTALNEEALALTKEYNRIVRSATYNSFALLDGSTSSIRLQGGFDIASAISVSPVAEFQQDVSSGGFGAVAGQGAGYYDQLIADLNNDGFADMVRSYVISNFDVGGIDVQYGNGDGTFQTAESYVMGYGPRSLTTGDMNDDGLLEIVAYSTAFGSTQLNVLTQANDGSFTVSTTVEAGIGGVSVNDVNNDGNDDVITTYNNSTFKIWTSNGSGGFSGTETVTVGATAYSVGLGDFNGDGIADALVGSHINRGLYVSSGGTAFQTNLGGLPSNSHYYTGFIIDDINGDGHNDIGMFDQSTGDLEVYLGDSKGGRSSIRLSSATGGAVGNEIEWGYYNGDEYLDAAVTDTGGNLHMVFGSSDGTFSGRVTSAGGGDGLSVADINGDGIIDAGQTGASELRLRYGTAAGNSFLKPVDISTLYGAQSGVREVADLVDHLGTTQGAIGAIQSRLTAAANVTGGIKLDAEAAASRITNADIASDAARLVRLNILQQFDTAIVAQANLQPGLVMQLLAVDSVEENA